MAPGLPLRARPRHRRVCCVSVCAGHRGRPRRALPPGTSAPATLCAAHGTVWIGRGLRDHLISRCRAQGHLPLARVAQNPIQPGFERFQGWSISGGCGPCPWRLGASLCFWGCRVCGVPGAGERREGGEGRLGSLPGCRQVGSCREFHSCCPQPFQMGHGVEAGKLRGAEEWGWFSAPARRGDAYRKPRYLRIASGTW